MKYSNFKIFVLCLILSISCLGFGGCSSKQEPIVESSVEALTLCELEQVDGVENLSDETIKALSVIIRSNVQNTSPKSFAYVPNNKRLAELSASTSGKTLSSLLEPSSSTLSIGQYSKETFNNIPYINGSKTWSVEIKKSQILSYLQKNNINLSNISSFEPVYLEDGTLDGIKLGGKFISYEVLSQEFGLKSNKITNISNTLSKIVVEGEYTNTFIIEDAETLSKNGMDYNDILKTLLL